MISLVIFVACLMGGAGVVLAAAAAHLGPALQPGAGLDGASLLLLIHAAAVLAAAGLIPQRLLWPPLALLAIAGFILGAALFAADISMRAFAGNRLFPMAAPIGGTLLILSWLAVAGASLANMRRRFAPGKGPPSGAKFED